MGINIGFQEGLLLKSFCSLKHIGKIVEIGTQYGCSTTWMAMGLRERGHIWTLEKDSGCVAQAEISFKDPDFLALGCQVHLLEGPAHENLNDLKKQGPFDLVFIDANKAGYLDYLNWARENIVPGGMIVADNIYLFGSLFEDQCPKEIPGKMWQVMNEFLVNIFRDQNFESSIIPTKDGFLLATKREEPVRLNEGVS